LWGGSIRLPKAVTVVPFDSEGWESEGKRWSEELGYHERNEPLSTFLSRALSIPEAEAEALAAEVEGPIFDDWMLRGGLYHERKIGALSLRVMVALAGLVVLALLGVALLIWVIVA
jgi:hypothetical protein